MPNTKADMFAHTRGGASMRHRQDPGMLLDMPHAAYREAVARAPRQSDVSACPCSQDFMLAINNALK